jgi:glycosyltransferase involved in cell wall biosynthesis
MTKVKEESVRRDQSPGVTLSMPHVAVRPSRILLVVDSFYPGAGGLERQVEVISEALYKAGYDVQITTPWLERSRPLQETIRGVPVTRITYPAIKGLGTLILMLKFALKLIRERNNYTAIHVHMAKNLASVVGMVRPFLKATTIAKISGAWEFNGGVLDPALRSNVFYRIMGYFIRRVDYIQTISSYTKRRLEQAGFGPEQILMIPNGVELSRFPMRSCPAKALAASGELRILFAGRLVRVKALDVLLKAWGSVVHACPEKKLSLLVAGEGPLKHELMQQAERLGISDSVTFLGLVQDMPALFAQADMYVQPSLQEGLPNAVIEAMACGLPIVATKVSGNEDLVHHNSNGILVEPGNVHLLAEALLVLINDREKRVQMGKVSRRIIEEHYQLPMVIEKLVRVYHHDQSPNDSCP